MLDETGQDIVQNIDEKVNIGSIPEEKVRKIEFEIHHWTELKTTPYSCERDMLFPEDVLTGCVKPINCNLSGAKTGGGERAQVRYIQFDESYFKYQFVALFRDLLFECVAEDDLPKGDEFDRIRDLISDALVEFLSVKDDLIDNDKTSKAIKPKDVTTALKAFYKPKG